MSKLKKVKVAGKEYFIVEDKVKIVKRSFTPMLPGDDPELHTRKIGGSMSSSGKPLSGLSFDEESILLPKIIKVRPTSDKWEEAVDAYWSNISKIVPNKGLPLNLNMLFTIETDAERYIKRTDVKDMCDGIPENFEDYVLWRYALVYGRVANSPEEQYKSNKIWFYIFSEEREKRKAYTSAEERKKAYERYLKIYNNEETVNNVLRLLGTEPRWLDLEAKIIKLESEVIARPDEFLKFTETGFDLELYSFIEEAVNAGVLEIVPNTDIIKISGKDEILGNNKSAAVAFLKNKENVTVYNILKKQTSVQLKN